jgi:hypothetical protein
MQRILYRRLTKRKSLRGFGVVDLPGRWLEKQTGEPPERFEFYPTSRFLRVNGCPNETNCGFYDYIMVDGQGLKLIKKKLLPKEFQSTTKRVEFRLKLTTISSHSPPRRITPVGSLHLHSPLRFCLCL